MIERRSETQGDLLHTKEVLVFKMRGITISGKSGTGKTVAMDRLGDRLSIKRKFKTGDLLRKVTNAGNASRDFIERDEIVDLQMDHEQREIIKNATFENPMILEGRLAGFIAAEAPDILRILFQAPEDERMRRILKRAVQEKDQEKAHLHKEAQRALRMEAHPAVIEYLYARLEEEEGETLDLSTVKPKEKRREKGDLNRWRKHHPRLIGISPFSPTLKNSKGQRIYDLVVDTGALTVEQTVEQIIEGLLGKGLAEKITVKVSIPTKAVVFQN